jgi:hypothetical protein
MTAVCAAAHGLSALGVSWTSTGAGFVLAGLLAFYILAYVVVNREKALPFLKLGRSGFEVGFKPFKKEDDDEERG